MHQIEVADIKIDVVRKNIKNLHLTVYPPGGRVRISSPHKINDDMLRRFAISKLAWIKKQQCKFREQERETSCESLYRETHYFLGRKYLLNIIETGKHTQVLLNAETMDLYIKKGADRTARKAVIMHWYRRELKKLIPGLLARWEKAVGVKANEWGVKLMKTKWGTCNINAKRIWLNLELIKKPLHCLEYVIVHELVHLLERLHNDRFRKYLDDVMPDWKSYKAELNRLPIGYPHVNQ